MAECNMCGKDFDIWDQQLNFIIDKSIGYGSKHDGDRIKLRLCCNCFDEVIDNIMPACKIDPLCSVEHFATQEPEEKMNLNEENQLRDTFTKSLKDIFRKGLLQGSKAMCTVIIEKTNDTEKTPEQRVEEIRRFCEISLKKHESKSEAP